MCDRISTVVRFEILTVPTTSIVSPNNFSYFFQILMTHSSNANNA